MYNFFIFNSFRTKNKVQIVHRLVCTNQFVARDDLLVFLGILYILPKN